MFCTVTLVAAVQSICAVPNTIVFCSTLISCFPGMLLRYRLSDIEMVPVASVSTGIAVAFTFHMRWFLYFKNFSASFFVTFLYPGIATYWNVCSLSIITEYDVRFIVRSSYGGSHLLVP